MKIDISNRYSQEEVTDIFIQKCHDIVKYWKSENCTIDKKCDGIMFSMLNFLDNGDMNYPSVNLILNPHPTDKKFNIDNGKKYYELGMQVNNVELHELYCKNKE